MKLFSKILGLTVGILLVGCNTLNNLTPDQVATIGTVITQVSNQGASYAIQQDPKNAAYFKAAIPVLDNFANGTDLSPATLQQALANTPYATNQWVGLAITAVVTTYDITYSKYISNQLTNALYAKVWILAVETGFKQATGVSTLVKAETSPTTPDFIVNGKVDNGVIKTKIKNALKK